jgi:hypothetical protein
MFSSSISFSTVSRLPLISSVKAVKRACSARAASRRCFKDTLSMTDIFEVRLHSITGKHYTDSRIGQGHVMEGLSSYLCGHCFTAIFYLFHNYEMEKQIISCVNLTISINEIYCIVNERYLEYHFTCFVQHGIITFIHHDSNC